MSLNEKNPELWGKAISLKTSINFFLCVLLSVFLFISESYASGAKPAEKKESAAPPANPNLYIHHWLPMPSFSSPVLPLTGASIEIKAKIGRNLVLFFLASWCEPCQERLASFKELEKQFTDLNTDFIYVFAHDAPEDAEGFVKDAQLQRAVLASYDALKVFHNPLLPSVYVSDRRGWLAGRYLNATDADIKRLSHSLKYWTAY